VIAPVQHASWPCCGARFVYGERHKCLGRGKALVERGAQPPPTADLRHAPSRFRATPTTRDGIRFGSKGEAGLWDYAKGYCAVIIPHVRFPLALRDERDRALWFTPDLFFPTLMECWEYKARAWKAGHDVRGGESRDYRVRAAAFRQAWPSITLRVFRMERGELREDGAAL
jgi:hypothetical protein